MQPTSRVWATTPPAAVVAAGGSNISVTATTTHNTTMMSSNAAAAAEWPLLGESVQQVSTHQHPQHNHHSQQHHNNQSYNSSSSTTSTTGNNTPPTITSKGSSATTTAKQLDSATSALSSLTLNNNISGTNNNLNEPDVTPVESDQDGQRTPTRGDDSVDGEPNRKPASVTSEEELPGGDVNSSGKSSAAGSTSAGQGKKKSKKNWRPLEIPVQSSKPEHRRGGGRGGKHRDESDYVPRGGRGGIRGSGPPGVGSSRENGEYHMSDDATRGYRGNGRPRPLRGRGMSGRGGRALNGYMPPRSKHFSGGPVVPNDQGMGRLSPNFDDMPADIAYYVDYAPISDPSITPGEATVVVARPPLLSPTGVTPLVSTLPSIPNPIGIPSVKQTGVTSIAATVIPASPTLMTGMDSTGTIVAVTPDGHTTPVTGALYAVGPFYPPPAAFAPLQPPIGDPLILQTAIRAQIEYYFSDENLQRDIFIRRKMDAQGYLPISLIASFHRVQNLTQDVNMIIDSLKDSQTVELSDNKLKARTKNDPARWPIGGGANNSTTTTMSSSTTTSTSGSAPATPVPQQFVYETNYNTTDASNPSTPTTINPTVNGTSSPVPPQTMLRNEVPMTIASKYTNDDSTTIDNSPSLSMNGNLTSSPAADATANKNNQQLTDDKKSNNLKIVVESNSQPMTIDKQSTH